VEKELKCEDLNVKDCDFVVRGDTPKDVIEQAVEHLREEHDISLPDAQRILDGKGIEHLEDQARLVAQRIREALDIKSEADTPGAGPGEPPPNVTPGRP